jgi:hypothetical protein
MPTLKTLSTVFKPEIATEIHKIASSTNERTIGEIVTLCFEKHTSSSASTVYPTGVANFIGTLENLDGRCEGYYCGQSEGVR